MQPSAKQVQEATSKLAKAVRKVFSANRTFLEQLKAEASRGWKDPEFIWRALLDAFSTLGGSRGLKLIEDPALYSRVQFGKLPAEPDKRAEKIEEIYKVMREAGVRYPRLKAGWVVEAADRIVAEGGPERVKEQILACEGKEAKIRFLKTFKGIGDKYARDILMSVDDADFRESIAVDSRVMKVGKAVGVVFQRVYPEAENFFLHVAHEAGLTGWELDRTVYERTDEVLEALGGPPPNKRAGTVRRCRQVTGG